MVLAASGIDGRGFDGRRRWGRLALVSEMAVLGLANLMAAGICLRGSSVSENYLGVIAEQSNNIRKEGH